MRFVIMNKSNDHYEAGNPPSPELVTRMGEFLGEAAASGVLLQADGLMPSSKGARIQVHGHAVSITDGPFAEANELIGGLAFIEVRSLAEAKEWGRRLAVVHGNCQVEIRQVSAPESTGS